MGRIENIKNFISSFLPEKTVVVRENVSAYNGYNMIPFDGEKTPYEMGQPIDYSLDYYALRARAWEAFIKSSLVQNAIKKYCLWIVGSGLKFQLDPVVSLLKANDIDIDPNDFIEKVEDRFRLYASSRESVYNRMTNLHLTASEALKNAMLNGDCLCVLRFDGKRTSMEIIDGYYIQSPYNLDQIVNGNKVIQGVEINSSGEHIAFYILQDDMTHRRVDAYSKRTGRLQAWMMYGMKHKIKDVRGMSLLTAILEDDAKLGRYKDATLGAAEENAKVPFTIEHAEFSDGENPVVNQLAQTMGKGKGVAPETEVWESCNSYATKIAQTTNKTVYNLPRGAKLERHSGSTDANFNPYYTINMEQIYTTLGIPPEVAMDKFGGSYSASRAALKSWEYKMIVDRNNLLGEYFYKPFFFFWFDIEVLRNNIDAPGYLKAMFEKDYYVKEAYKKCKFTGAGVPHIDPLKEAMASRKKLGTSFDSIPLTTMDIETENLNTGDSNQIIKKAENEKNMASSFDVP